MKKTILYGLSISLAALSSFSLTSCIDEVEPTSGVTESQVQGSNSSVKALLMGVHANMVGVWDSDFHFSWGYPAIMHIRDIETEDMATYDPGTYYSGWFGRWGRNEYQGQDYIFAQFLWNFQVKMVKTANSVLESIDPTDANDELKGYAAAAFAYRAAFYLDMAREYEFLENDVTDPVSPEGNSVKGLTVPIVKENITEEEARNNPRATREQMAEFILSDLKSAEEWIGNLTIRDNILPHLDVVYGLYARYYMWLENYPEAEKYARMAINASSSTPMTKEDALDTKTGFNTASKWMWAMNYTKETINNNLLNWYAWMCNETTYGYSGPQGGGCEVMIDRNLYYKISNTDWRKLLWKAPAGSALEGKNTYCDDAMGEMMQDLASLKFRPGSGDTKIYTVGNVAGVPLMRVEEMYLIEAEAAAHQDVERGKQLIETFMLQNRDYGYSCSATTNDDLVKEIILQKRIELWGEGQTFFDVKRLNMPVTRGYSQSNHLPDELLNTTTRPAWMNWVIVKNESNGNKALVGYNNPDPTGKYSKWTNK